MKLKKEYLFLLLAIAALSAYLGLRSKDQTHFDLPQLTAVEFTTINRIVLTKSGNVIEIQKKDDQWFIGSKAYRADNIKINNMAKAAGELTLTALVSESENYERYGLGKDQKINVQAFVDNKAVRIFEVGGVAPTFKHTFVSLNEDPKVYHAQGKFDATFNITLDQLRDRIVLSYEKDEIMSLYLARGQQRATFTRKEVAPPDQASNEQKEAQATQWVDAEGNAIGQQGIQRLISMFASFRCDGYMADDSKKDLKDPLWTLTLKSAKENFELSIFDTEDQDQKQFPATSSGSPYAFILKKNHVASIEMGLDKLLAPEAKETVQK